jgi:hypothetical protein
MTFAPPCVGNDDCNKEFQTLEKDWFLRHIRTANEGDVVPTNHIIPPFSFLFWGDTGLCSQNGVNLFLRSREKLETDYRNTKAMPWSRKSSCGSRTISSTVCSTSTPCDWNYQGIRKCTNKLWKKFTKQAAAVSLTTDYVLWIVG